MERYTSGRVWSILLDGSEDLDELIDIQVGLDLLPSNERVFLDFLRAGYTGATAMREAHMTGNQTRLKRQVLEHLTRLMNGES
jgi:hypothetical protein